LGVNIGEKNGQEDGKVKPEIQGTRALKRARGSKMGG